ncbi:MAG TPA: T9SS type A sorting domain-containing protein [Flavobacteriales bacterium]|nr:T9SS type A sorting domain-containing protein [Flavobacteriales bacterium]HMR29041.1 T9SS type A sorting domain-containing protein [Flavobacteriales bacterium]
MNPRRLPAATSRPLFLLVALPALCQAQFGPPQLVHEAPIRSLQRSAVGDVDGDGLNDIVLGADFRADLGWMKGLGPDAFGPVRVLEPQSTGITELRLADLDADGDMDILASTDDGSIFWKANDGGANFGARQMLLTGGANQFAFFDLADLDGDTDADLSYAVAETGVAAWCENLGGGAFSPATALTPSTFGAGLVQAGDLDGDGDTDLLIGGATLVRWYENDGTGLFTATHDVYTGSSNHAQLVLGDVDGDADPDIVGATGSSGANDFELRLYTNNGAGAFSAATVVQTYVHVNNGLELVDVDGDGDRDILARATAPNDGLFRIRKYVNSGTGTFATPVVVDQLHMNHFRSGDVDADGDRDLVVLYEGGHMVEVRDNAGDGLFAVPITHHADYAGCTRTQAVDMDQDGDLDIATSQSNVGGIIWYEDVGGLDFDVPHVVVADRSYAAVVMEVKDMDADGVVDIVASEGTTGFVYWMRGLGAGAFGPRVNLYALADGSSSFALVDLDGDGDEDIVVPCPQQGRVIWIRNEGNGTFALPAFPNIGTGLQGPVRAVPMDVDGDGDTDVISSASTNGNIQWHRNDGYNGPGTPVSTTITASGADAGTLCLLDVDADGEEDIVYERISDHALVWRQRTGPSTFAAAAVLTTVIGNAESMVVHDVDQDGDGDLLFRIGFGGDQFWSRNDGAGVFAATAVLLAGASALGFADLDGDGSDDVIYHLGVQEQLVWSGNQFNINTGLSASEPVHPGTVRVHPNPATEAFTVSWSMPDEPTHLELFDATGRCVLVQRISGGQQAVVPGAGLEPGRYVLRVRRDGTVLGRSAVVLMR